MSHNIFRIFKNVSVDAGGTTITHILGGPPFTLTGTLEQVVISRVSGAVTVADLQLRYNDASALRTDLVYLYEDAAIVAGTPFVDSSIAAPFSLKVRLDPISDGDLSFFINPDADCVLSIRLDFTIDRYN